MQIQDMINVLKKLDIPFDAPKVYGTAPFYQSRYDSEGMQVKLRQFSTNGKYFLERVYHEDERSMVVAIEVEKEQYEKPETFRKTEFAETF